MQQGIASPWQDQMPEQWATMKLLVQRLSTALMTDTWAAWLVHKMSRCSLSVVVLSLHVAPRGRCSSRLWSRCPGAALGCGYVPRERSSLRRRNNKELGDWTSFWLSLLLEKIELLKTTDTSASAAFEVPALKLNCQFFSYSNKNRGHIIGAS